MFLMVDYYVDFEDIGVGFFVKSDSDKKMGVESSESSLDVSACSKEFRSWESLPIAPQFSLSGSQRDLSIFCPMAMTPPSLGQLVDLRTLTPETKRWPWTNRCG
jgi:hypothetical protein